MKLRILGVRYKEKSSSFMGRRAKHSAWEVYYIDRGAIHLIVGPLDFHLEQGEICLVPPDVIHSAWAEKTKAPNIVDVHFYASPGDLLTLANQKHLLSDVECEAMRNLVREIQNPLPYQDEIMESLFSYLLHSLLRRVKLKKPQIQRASTAPQRNLRALLIEQAKNYVKTHLADPLSLNSVARAIGVSPSHLSHTFSSVEAAGVKGYIRKSRIETAKDLLRNSSLSVTEIADRVGFSSIHHFSRTFKAETGSNPSEYARSLR